MRKQRHIGFEIKTLSNLLRRKILEFAPPPEDSTMTDMQGQIVTFLYANRDREIFQRDVEEEFSIRRSTASRFLRGMEEKGVLTRCSVPHDARLKKLILTPKVITKHEQIREKIEELEAIVSNGLTKEEIDLFFEIAAKIKKNIS